MSADRMNEISLIATVAANVKWLTENIEGGIEISMHTKDFKGGKEGLRPECSLMFQDWDMRSLADYRTTPGPYLMDLEAYQFNTGTHPDLMTDGVEPEPDDDPFVYIDEAEFLRIQAEGGPWEIEFHVRRNPMQEQWDER